MYIEGNRFENETHFYGTKLFLTENKTHDITKLVRSIDYVVIQLMGFVK